MIERFFMLRIVYLTAVLLSEAVLAQLKILGYSVRQVGASSHLVGFEWPKGHHCAALSENPLYLGGGGRFCIEYNPNNDGGKFFCPSYQPGGELNLGGRLYVKTLYEVTEVSGNLQVWRYVIAESSQMTKPGFQG